MKPRWVVALGVLVIAATIAWSRMEPEPLPPLEIPDPPAPIALVAPVDSPPPPVAPRPVAPVVVDAGPALPSGPVEVTIELLSRKGHVAGRGFKLAHRATGDVASATTDVMGFARLRLAEGTWEFFREKAELPTISVSATNRHFAILLPSTDVEPGVTTGVVVGDDGKPVPYARILASRGYGSGRYWQGAMVLGVADHLGLFELILTGTGIQLMAEHNGRVSVPQHVRVGAKDVVLSIYSPAFVRLALSGSACTGAFVQIEGARALLEVALGDPGDEWAVPSGLTKFRGRCLDGRTLMYGYHEVALEPFSQLRVVVELAASRGLLVRVIDAMKAKPMSDAALTLYPHPSLPDGGVAALASTLTNFDGVAELVPSVLTAFDPAYRVELTGPKTATKLARLGDAPSNLIGFPAHLNAVRRAQYLELLGPFDAGF